MRLRTGLFLAAVPVLLFAADSWQKKDPAEWTAKDAQQVLTHSPWAREAASEFNPERMGGGGGMRGMPPGGPGGGGPEMGGPGGGGPPGGGPGMGGGPEGFEPPKFTVLWASSMPAREAAIKAEDPNAKQIAEWSEKYYVVTLTGGMRRGMRAGRRPNNAAGDSEREERMARMRERLKENTSLRIKGKDPIQPERIERLNSGETFVTVFLFPRTVEIGPQDKDVTLETAMGPLELKTTFNLKDMVFHGKLDL